MSEPVYSHENTRRAVRRAVDVPCELITFDVDQPMAGRAKDLSPFGMWLETTHPFAVGEEIVISFQAPHLRSGDELTVFGEVARVTMERGPNGRPNTGLGIEFIGLSPTEHERLEHCLLGTPPPAPRHKPRRHLN